MDLDSPVNIRAPDVGWISLSALLGGGRLTILNNNNATVGEFQAGLGVTVLTLGGSEYFGTVLVKDATGKIVIHLNGRDGDITLFNGDGDQTLRLNGAVGDIALTGGDAAEDFELADQGVVPPGSVMVITDQGSSL